MKTDRELLELAAKAAGITLRWIQGPNDDECIHPIRRRDDGMCEVDWNPLTDDGDALRLAVAMRFSVFAGCDWCTVRGGTKKVKSDTRFKIDEHIGWDEYDRRDRAGATRRAITRAAAAIGEGE